MLGNRAGIDDRGNVPHLVKFAWTDIVRHQLVTGTASPDDPDLIDYWARRRRRVKPAGRLQPAPAHQAGRPLPPLRISAGASRMRALSVTKNGLMRLPWPIAA